MKKEKLSGLRPLKKTDEPKEQLDQKTSYLTLLPHMEDGFGMGYQSVPGIVNDTNQKPHEWLENIGKYMQTQGEDVGYSIPDVLAGEQQMRRLMRLPYEEAIRHQEMIDWRGTLALLLLWDSWEQDADWPQLSLEDFMDDADDTMAFQRTVSAALTQERMAEGLKVFALTGLNGQKPDKRPIGLLSRSVILMPAANPGDLSGLLPEKVRWYDRRRKRWQDPSPFLSEKDRERLILGLRVLQCMNEQEAVGSDLFAKEAALCSPLERFIDELQGFRTQWRQRIAQGEPEAVKELYIRTLAVYGLMDGKVDIKGLEQQLLRLRPEEFAENALIRALRPGPLGGVVPEVNQTLYAMNGQAFARGSAAWLLEPTNETSEAQVLSSLEQEETLLCEYNEPWNLRLAQRLTSAHDRMRTQIGASPAVLELLQGWIHKHEATSVKAERRLKLSYPIEGHPQTLGVLTQDLIGTGDVAGICGAFSDGLLVVLEVEQPPFQSPEMNAACQVLDEKGQVLGYALPPLSPWMAGWLMDEAEKAEGQGAKLELQSLSFVRDAQSGAIRTRFTVSRQKHGQDALLTSAVTFTRTYQAREGAGGITLMKGAQLPFVVAWPNVRLNKDLWKQYFVYAHEPEHLDIWVRNGDAWVQGPARQTADISPRGQSRTRRWQTCLTQRYPAFVTLKRGTLSLGAIINDAPRQPIRHEPAAVIGIDFGSIATTVMMRQGDKLQPATFTRALHGLLLHGSPGEEEFLADELLPLEALVEGSKPVAESTFYSVMDMFTDDSTGWQTWLEDGHIYYRGTLGDLIRKNESALYYDLKWGEESYILQCLRLFLKQVMMQASLCARLSGAPSLSWRISMPNALPLYRQEAYLEMMRGLSQEVAAETGMRLTADKPNVLYATENQADGLYFRSRNEVNVRSGYLNLDIGGGTSDISLWLNNARRATLETSLRLGCRQMLYESIASWNAEAFIKDFEGSSEAMQTIVKGIAKGLGEGNMRGQQKALFLLDDFFAQYDREIWKMMASQRTQGRISYVESLLLLNISFLFHLSGEMLGRSWADEAVRPLLSPRMEVCVAGNGGQLLKAFDNETKAKLCRIALQGLDPSHPVRELLLVQSRHPKQEVAIGLLEDEMYLRSAIHGEADPGQGEQAQLEEGHEISVMKNFFQRFAGAFPQAAQRLLPAAMTTEPGAKASSMNASAIIELETIIDNEFLGKTGDDFAAFVRCFAAAKRVWRV